MNKKRIGILTGGGDAPGLNAIIEGIIRGLRDQFEVVGICDGFEGVFEGRHKMLTSADVYGIHTQAGTLLGTSNRSAIKGRENEFLQKFKLLNLNGLIVAGGDGTFSALKLVGEIPLIGIPKTIDNDLSGTEKTFGFDTACEVVADSADALRATADAHRRVFVIETMGRTAGWIALGGGLASLADAILIPERDFTRESLAAFIKQKQSAGIRSLIVVVAEGARFYGEKANVIFSAENSPQKERYGGIAQLISRWIEGEIGWESRHVVLGHLQRSRHPTTADRFLTLAMGAEACRLVSENKWGSAVVYRGGLVQNAPIADIMQGPRLVPTNHHWLSMAEKLGLFI